MRYLLCLLFVISSVIAQPIEGPWTISDDLLAPLDGLVLLPVSNNYVNVFFSNNIWRNRSG